MKFKQIFGSFPAFPVLFVYFHPLIDCGIAMRTYTETSGGVHTAALRVMVCRTCGNVCKNALIVRRSCAAVLCYQIAVDAECGVAEVFALGHIVWENIQHPGYDWMAKCESALRSFSWNSHGSSQYFACKWHVCPTVWGLRLWGGAVV